MFHLPPGAFPCSVLQGEPRLQPDLWTASHGLPCPPSYCWVWLVKGTCWRSEGKRTEVWGYSSPTPASFLVQVLAMAIPIHSYSFCLVGPRAQPASQWQGKCFSALSGPGPGQPPAVARLWEPQYSYGFPQPCPPSPFIKMPLLDHLREFVTPAGISNDGPFKTALNSAWDVVNAL